MNEQIKTADLTAGALVHESLTAKLHENYKEFVCETVQLTASEVFSLADTIALTREIYNDLLNTDYGEQSEYLLRFKNPLKVVCDKVEVNQSYGLGIEEAIETAMQDLYDARDIETECELDAPNAQTGNANPGFGEMQM